MPHDTLSPEARASTILAAFKMMNDRIERKPASMVRRMRVDEAKALLIPAAVEALLEIQMKEGQG
jgi:hypothetical protein